jgi:murein L,D-transpeptidase YafK
MVRLRSLTVRPAPDVAPRSVLQLRDDQKHVLVVDAKQSRLYVYQNRGGQLKFVTDYYITQGKLGVNKLREGDQKTPIGVYYITGRVAQAKLPPFYGAGALRINYPNDWDKLNGRSGSGIWLHGTPFDSYSRPPLASDGCVVLTNTDLKQLSLSVDIGKTPVVIADQVEFINKAKWDAERNGATQMLETWRHDIESMDPKRLLKNYSVKFKSGMGDDLNTWFEKNKTSFSGANALSVKLKDLTLFRYPGREDVIVGTFTQETSVGRSKSVIRKRQYWAREGKDWKIVFESIVQV